MHNFRLPLYVSKEILKNFSEIVNISKDKVYEEVKVQVKLKERWGCLNLNL